MCRDVHISFNISLGLRSCLASLTPSQPPVFALFPEIPNVAPGDRESKATTDLIGEVIRYRTLDTDEISEFRIVDYGKTHVTGEWFVVTCVRREGEADHGNGYV